MRNLYFGIHYSSGFMEELGDLIDGLSDFFSNLTYSVSLSNPVSLLVLYVMGLVTDIGLPLALTLEIFLVFTSFYAGPVSMQVFLIITMLILGRETGSAVLYWISRLVGTSFLDWITRHFAWVYRKIPAIKKKLKKRETLMVVLVRLTPGFLQVPAIVAGSLHLDYVRFVIGVALSSLVYDFGLVLFGFAAHQVLGSAVDNLQDYIIIGFIIFIVVVWLVLFWRFRNIFA